MDKKGYSSLFSAGNYYLFPTDIITQHTPNLKNASVLEGTLTNEGLYTVKMQSGETPTDKNPTIALMTSVPSRSLYDWHLALGHLHYDALKHLLQNRKDIKIKDKNWEKFDCEACLVGKSKQQPYKTSTRIITDKGT